MLNLIFVGLMVVLYLGIVVGVKKEYMTLPSNNWGFEGVLLLYRTNSGLQTIEKIANTYTRKWRSLGTIGAIVGTMILFAGSVFIVFSAIMVILNPSEQQVTSPTNYLVIPGVNDFLPLSVGVEIIAGLFIAMVVHEGGHAILSRVEGIDLESTGLVFFSILPIGAFVEPNEESQENASKKSRLRMFAAGITNNIIATFIFIGLLFIMGIFITPATGAAVGGVIDNSPADHSGLSSGDVITSVNGKEISSQKDYISTLKSIEDRSIKVTTTSGKTYTINRVAFTSQTVESEFVGSLSQTKTFISSINGKTVYTVNSVGKLLASDGNRAVIQTNKGQENIPVGGLATVQKEGLLSGVSKGDNIVILSVNGKRTHTGKAVKDVLNSSGDKTKITYLTTNKTAPVTKSVYNLKSQVVIYKGYTGLQFSDIGTKLYPVHTFNLLASPLEESTSILQWIVIFFFAPFASLAGLEHNFFGFEGIAGGIYTSTIGFDPVIFFLANIFFWTAWININLAIFNCLPTYMLDGGHMLRDGSSLIGEKLHLSSNISDGVTHFIQLVILVSLIAMMFAPMIL